MKKLIIALLLIATPLAAVDDITGITHTERKSYVTDLSLMLFSGGKLIKKYDDVDILVRDAATLYFIVDDQRIRTNLDYIILRKGE
jgi:hypothetical protein